MKEEERIRGKTVIEWETELSTFNRKTLYVAKFKDYIRKKSEINGLLFTFYEKYIFRKLRLQSYRNTKRSEQKMLNNFKQTFGDEEEVIVCFGDLRTEETHEIQGTNQRKRNANFI